MDSEKNVPNRILPEPIEISSEKTQQHHYKRIVAVVAIVFVVGILAALAYALFLSPNSRFLKLDLNTKKDQVLREQYEAEQLAETSEFFNTRQSSVKTEKPLTEAQTKALQAQFSSGSSDVSTEAEIKALEKSFESRSDAKEKADQKAYEEWKAAQPK